MRVTSETTSKEFHEKFPNLELRERIRELTQYIIDTYKGFYTISVEFDTESGFKELKVTKNEQDQQPENQT